MGVLPHRLQNSPYFCVYFKHMQAVKQKVEQTPLNRSQQLPAPYKRLIDEIKQN